jgi:hypothetical protein
LEEPIPSSSPPATPVDELRPSIMPYALFINFIPAISQLIALSVSKTTQVAFLATSLDKFFWGVRS